MSSVPTPALTNREIDVIWLLSDGATNDQIALALGISPETVQQHVKRIRDKLGAQTRAHAIARALHDGILDESAGRRDVFVHQAIRDEAGEVVDSRLVYFTPNAAEDHPDLRKHQGQPMSSWYPNYAESDIFRSVVRALQGDGETFIDSAIIEVPWAPGYKAIGRGKPVGNDRVFLIADEYPQPEGLTENPQ